jgi:hypothetical protein
VIEKPEAKYDIELAEFADTRVFDVRHRKADLRITLGRVGDVLWPAVKRCDAKRHRLERASEITLPRSGI